MRTAGLAKLTIVIGIVSVLAGCTSLFKSSNVPPPLKPDAAPEANFQPLSASADSCSSPILEPERSALLQEALADSQLQAVKAQLERHGLSINTDEAQAVQLAGGQQLLIPFGEDAHLVWTRTNGQTAAVGLIRQGNKTLNISVAGEERVVRFLPMQKVEKLLAKLRQKPEFQQFEGKLAQKGKRVGKIRVLFDETNKIAILGIANEGDEERIAHQVRIKMKPDKDDEPEDDAEPAIQATACGQATGEAVPMGARLHAQMYDAGEGGDLIGSSYDVSEGNDYGPELCTSQWGYDYLCTWTTPLLSLSLTGFPLSLTLPQTFITQQTQASFVIWNGGGGRLSGTVSVPAPFSIVSGSSFSLLPGQPQEVVVRFSSTTPGSFSKGISISSNGGSKTVTATGVAHKISFSPAQVDFGSTLITNRVEQVCQRGLVPGQQVCEEQEVYRAVAVERDLAVKNEGTVAVTLTLSTAAPYRVVSGGTLTLSPGQSAQMRVKFDPSESGSFTGNVQVRITGGQGGVTSSPLIGVAHKIEIQPAELNFGIVIIGTTGERKLTVKNQGVTTVSLTVSTAAPFSIGSEGSFTLAPSESRDVAVRVSPAASGSLSGSVRLTSGQNDIPVFIRGRAFTYEEYLQRLLDLYNAATQSDDTYGIAYASHPQYESDLLLVGFKDLTKERIEQLYAEISQYNGQPVQPVDPQLVEALQLLSTIDLQQLADWITTLAQALSEGRFDEEYERLIPQGLYQFEEVIMLARGLQDREAAKISIYEAIDAAIQEQPQLPPQVVAMAIINSLLSILLDYFTDYVFTEDVVIMLKRFKEYCETILGLLFNNGMVNESVPFALSLYFISLHIISFFPPPDPSTLPGQQGVNSWTQFLDLRSFLLWMIGTGGTYAPTRKDRLEQGLGTLYTATALLCGHWVLVAFRANNDWQGLIMWLSPEQAQLGDGRGVVAVIRGDNCSQCASKARIIEQWVLQALRELPSLRFQLVNNEFWSQFTKNGFMELIMLTFTKPGAQGINTIITALKDNPTIRNSETPIMVLSLDENGNVQFQCISIGCEKLQQEHPELIEKIKQAFARALALAMAAYPGLSPQVAWWLAYGICGGDPDCIFSLADQIARELGSSGGGANCQKIKLHPLLRQKLLMPC